MRAGQACSDDREETLITASGVTFPHRIWFQIIFLFCSRDRNGLPWLLSRVAKTILARLCSALSFSSISNEIMKDLKIGPHLHYRAQVVHIARIRVVRHCTLLDSAEPNLPSLS